MKVSTPLTSWKLTFLRKKNARHGIKGNKSYERSPTHDLVAQHEKKKKNTEDSKYGTKPWEQRRKSEGGER